MRWSDFAPPFVLGAFMAIQSYAAFRTWGIECKHHRYRGAISDRGSNPSQVSDTGD